MNADGILARIHDGGILIIDQGWQKALLDQKTIDEDIHHCRMYGCGPALRDGDDSCAFYLRVGYSRTDYSPVYAGEFEWENYRSF